jgi:hypothetical protein
MTAENKQKTNPPSKLQRFVIFCKMLLSNTSSWIQVPLSNIILYAVRFQLQPIPRVPFHMLNHVIQVDIFVLEHLFIPWLPNAPNTSKPNHTDSVIKNSTAAGQIFKLI